MSVVPGAVRGVGMDEIVFRRAENALLVQEVCAGSALSDGEHRQMSSAVLAGTVPGCGGRSERRRVRKRYRWLCTSARFSSTRHAEIAGAVCVVVDAAEVVEFLACPGVVRGGGERGQSVRSRARYCKTPWFWIPPVWSGARAVAPNSAGEATEQRSKIET